MAPVPPGLPVPQPLLCLGLSSKQLGDLSDLGVRCTPLTFEEWVHRPLKQDSKQVVLLNYLQLEWPTGLTSLIEDKIKATAAAKDVTFVVTGPKCWRARRPAEL